MGPLMMGRRVHKGVVKDELGSKSNVRTALIEMYAKCSCLNSTNKIFNTYKEVFKNLGPRQPWPVQRCKMIKFEIEHDERIMTTILCYQHVKIQFG